MSGLSDTKECRDCGERKPLTEFYRRKQSPDGFALYCRDCFGLRNARQYRKRRDAVGAPVRPFVSKRDRPKLPEGFKQCPDCGQVLPVDAFVRSKSKADGVGSYCKSCLNARTRESRQRLHGGSRHYHLIRRYGIGADEVRTMLEAQRQRCPICLAPITEETAHVDHDHKTGAVRALLCFNCNGGLGQFKDDPALLRRAASYLEGDVWPSIEIVLGRYPQPS
jgi:Recombination endonuclease VII